MSQIGWIFTYLVPVAFSLWFLFDSNIFYITLAILMTYASYEIGYIYNDLELTKKEQNPTLRVNQEDSQYYETNKTRIYTIRLFILVAVGLMAIFISDVNSALAIFLTSLSILACYAVYNSMRNNWNLPLYAILIYLRYFGVIFFSFFNMELSVFLFLLYPLCKIFEFSTKPRFLLSKYIKIANFNVFRVSYYVCMLAFVLSFNYFVSELFFFKYYLIVACYFLIYRLFIYVVYRSRT